MMSLIVFCRVVVLNCSCKPVEDLRISIVLLHLLQYAVMNRDPLQIRYRILLHFLYDVVLSDRWLVGVVG